MMANIPGGGAAPQLIHFYGTQNPRMVETKSLINKYSMAKAKVPTIATAKGMDKIIIQSSEITSNKRKAISTMSPSNARTNSQQAIILNII